MEPNPFENMTDEQVLEMATKALATWSGAELGSVQRMMQRARFETAMAELDRRAVAFALARLAELSKPD